MPVRCANTRKVFQAALIALAVAIPAKSSAQYVYPAGLEQVGQARLSLLWIDLYDARLFTEDGEYERDEKPLLLELIYHREISATELLDETVSQLKERVESSRLSDGAAHLEALLPDVKQGDSLAFYLSAEGRGLFYFNGQFIGEMGDPVFNRAFLDIWLAPDSEFPGLTRRLTGGT